MGRTFWRFTLPKPLEETRVHLMIEQTRTTVYAFDFNCEDSSRLLARSPSRLDVSRML